MPSKKIFKICLAGDGGTGKTTLIATKKANLFQGTASITIGVDFACFPMHIEDHELTFLIFDLGGQSRFQFMHESYVIGTKAALILYDLTRPRTFDHIPHWISLFKADLTSFPILIAGTKMDLVQPADLRYFLRKWQEYYMSFPQKANLLYHGFISSKNYVGVDEIFHALATTLTPKSGFLMEKEIKTTDKIIK